MPPRDCRCGAARERRRAPTARSAAPPPAQRSSRRRARHGRARSRKRPSGSDRAGVQQLAGDADAEFARFGEVRQAQTAGLMLLAEDHIPLRAVQRPPSPHAPLQRPPRSGANRDGVGRVLRRPQSVAVRAPPSTSARSRCPRHRRRDQLAVVRDAPSFGWEAADPFQSGRRWPC